MASSAGSSSSALLFALHCRVGEETWASPTRLALVLAGGGGGGGTRGTAAADAAAGTIIVETNYRVGRHSNAPSALPRGPFHI